MYAAKHYGGGSSLPERGDEGAQAVRLSDYELFDEFSVRGRWWLPDAPEDRVPGALSLSDGHIWLVLDGRSFIRSSEERFTRVETT